MTAGMEASRTPCCHQSPQQWPCLRRPQQHSQQQATNITRSAAAGVEGDPKVRSSHTHACTAARPKPHSQSSLHCRAFDSRSACVSQVSRFEPASCQAAVCCCCLAVCRSATTPSQGTAAATTRCIGTASPTMRLGWARPRIREGASSRGRVSCRSMSSGCRAMWRPGPAALRCSCRRRVR